jgi:DNA-binding IclR family transcriptional regulator
MYELGLALPNHTQFQRRAESIVQSFAARMAGIALLQLRSGSEFVCSIRAGTCQMTGAMVYPGTRRPLFTSAGGVAILQTLPVDEAHAALMDNISQEISRHNTARLEALRKMREISDHHGFGVNFGCIVQGSHAFAVPVRGLRNDAFAALCLVGTPDIYREERLAELHAALLDAARLLEAEARKLGM